MSAAGKHTPGPWEVRKGRTLLHVVGAQPVCEISVSANHVHEDAPGDKALYIARQEANARLIAAAPELLEALKKAEQMLKSKGYTPAVLKVHGITAAIAKAMGAA